MSINKGYGTKKIWVKNSKKWNQKNFLVSHDVN